MSVELLNSCELSLQKIKNLYIASRKIDTSVIDFPIEYTTISGSSDSIIRVEDWNYVNNTLTIGGQMLDYREVSIIGQGENAEFTEDYSLTKQGKVYTKNLTFLLPRVNFQTNSAMKEFIFTAAGEFAIGKAVAFVIDENSKQWIIGYDSPLILQDGMELSIADENQYKLTFKATSQSRTRNYAILP